MSDPSWMRDLDVASYKTDERSRLAAIWASWAIGQLPPKLRRAAARAWKQGKFPVDLKIPVRLTVAAPPTSQPSADRAIG